jgi:hypothetical protein
MFHHPKCGSISFWLSRVAAHEDHGFLDFVLHFLSWWMRYISMTFVIIGILCLRTTTHGIDKPEFSVKWKKAIPKNK